MLNSPPTVSFNFQPTSLGLFSVDFSESLMYKRTDPLSVFSYYFANVLLLKDLTAQLCTDLVPI